MIIRLIVQLLIDNCQSIVLSHQNTLKLYVIMIYQTSILTYKIYIPPLNRYQMRAVTLYDLRLQSINPQTIRSNIREQQLTNHSPHLSPSHPIVIQQRSTQKANHQHLLQYQQYHGEKILECQLPLYQPVTRDLFSHSLIKIAHHHDQQLCQGIKPRKK